MVLSMSRGWVEGGRDASEEVDMMEAVEARRVPVVALGLGAGEVDDCFVVRFKLNFIMVGVPIGEAVGVLEEVMGPLKVLKLPDRGEGRVLYVVVDLGGDMSA